MMRMGPARVVAAAVLVATTLVFAGRDSPAVALAARPGLFLTVAVNADDGATALRRNFALVTVIVDAAEGAGVPASAIRTDGVSVVPVFGDGDRVDAYRAQDRVFVPRPDPDQRRVLSDLADRLGIDVASGSLTACPVSPGPSGLWTKQWSMYG